MSSPIYRDLVIKVEEKKSRSKRGGKGRYGEKGDALANESGLWDSGLRRQAGVSVSRSQGLAAFREQNRALSYPVPARGRLTLAGFCATHLKIVHGLRAGRGPLMS